MAQHKTTPIADATLRERIRQARATLGDQAVILGHHYQGDLVVEFADFRGDSYGLCQNAANVAAKYIIFAGVHFMAESAAILCRPDQVVILPNMDAGCVMADMARLKPVQTAWDTLHAVLDDAANIVPITYINSTADLKAFVGKNGGVVCTSSNARGALEWAFERGERVFFFPDQHLGRNTGKAMGIPLEQMVLWNPLAPQGGLTDSAIRNARIILWDGYCPIHFRFRPEQVDWWRERQPDIQILVHPECPMEVVDKADYVGSTGYIIKTVEAAPPGSKWAIGTEFHLVNRLKSQYPDKMIESLSPTPQKCINMQKITPLHLRDVLEALVAGRVVNQVTVPGEVGKYAKLALDRMLAIPK